MSSSVIWASSVSRPKSTLWNEKKTTTTSRRGSTSAIHPIGRFTQPHAPQPHTTRFDEGPPSKCHPFRRGFDEAPSTCHPFRRSPPPRRPLGPSRAPSNASLGPLELGLTHPRDNAGRRGGAFSVICYKKRAFLGIEDAPRRRLACERRDVEDRALVTMDGARSSGPMSLLIWERGPPPHPRRSWPPRTRPTDGTSPAGRLH